MSNHQAHHHLPHLVIVKKHTTTKLFSLLAVATLCLLGGPPDACAQRTITPSIVTQGNTSTASKVNVLLKNADTLLGSTDRLRVRVCDEDGYAVATNATIAPADGCTTVETHSSTKDLTLQSSIAGAATGVLTISGVVIDTQTVTIGSRVYEFDTHTTSTITSGRVRANISASATAAQGTLTMDTQPTAGDSMTIGTRTYVFVASGTADEEGEVSVGADLAAAKLAVVAAINGTDSVNTANSLVSAAAFSSDDSVLTAKAGGTAGNSVVTTETFTAGTNVFDAGTLGTTTAGTDCSAANAVTALVSAITGDSSAVVGAADGTGDTVDLTADEAGEDGNDIATTETMANGSFASATLTGGSDTLHGRFRFTVTNGTAETVVLRFGPPVVGAPNTDWSTVLEVTHAAP